MIQPYLLLLKMSFFNTLFYALISVLLINTFRTSLSPSDIPNALVPFINDTYNNFKDSRVYFYVHSLPLEIYNVLFSSVLLPISVTFLLSYFLNRHNPRIRNNARRFVTQSLGLATSSAEGVNVDDKNTNSMTTNPTTTNEITTSLQKQVAPVASETTVLAKSDTYAHYSTPMYVASLSVPSTANIGANVCFINSNQIYTNNNVKRLFIDKRFASFDIRFTINVTGNPMATGMVAFANVPCPLVLPTGVIAQDPALDFDWTTQYNRIMSLNNQIVDLSVDGVYTIDMPFTHFRSYLSWADYASTPVYAALWGVVMSPYLPPTGAPSSINFEVYASLINIKTVETAPYYSQSLFSFGETHNVSYQISDIKDSTLPSNVSGDHLSATVSDSVGLDNPSDTRNVSGMLRYAYQKLLSFRNVLDLVSFSSTPNKVNTFDAPICEDLRLDIDEMSMSFFRNRWFGRTADVFSVNSTTTANTLLYSSPLAAGFNSGATPVGVTNWANSMLGYLPMFFNYWRGTLRYRIIISSNSFKRGKLLVAIHYGDTALLPTGPVVTGSVDPRSNPHVIVDLSNADRFIDIDVPYKSVNEFTRCLAYNTPSATLPYNETSIGTLAVYLMSPIQPSADTSPVVNFNVLRAYGDDFNFYQDLPYPRMSHFTQSTLSPPSMMSSIDTRLAHVSSFNSLKELLLKPVDLGVYSLPNYPFSGASNEATAPLLIPISPAFLFSSPIWNMCMQSYCGLRGSMRAIIRVADQSPPGPLSVRWYPYLNAINSDGSQLTYTNAPPLQTLNPLAMPDVFNNNVEPTDMTYAFPIINSVGSSLLSNDQTAPNYRSYTFGSQVGPMAVFDTYNQPELIVEVPDPCPLYRTQNTSLVAYNSSSQYYQPFYPYGTTGKYNPLYDRNTPWLMIDYLSKPTKAQGKVEIPSRLHISVTAGDDLRFFWFNGGVTNGCMQSIGTIPTGSAYVYTTFNAV